MEEARLLVKRLKEHLEQLDTVMTDGDKEMFEKVKTNVAQALRCIENP